MPHIAWENRAAAKRASLLKAIPARWHITREGYWPNQVSGMRVLEMPDNHLSLRELEITETAAMDTLANLHTGVWSSEEVVRAYCHRAAVCHQLANCLTEVLFDEAIKDATAADQYRRDTGGGLRGPLHGLPMSFMDRFRIAGTETAAGFISWLGRKEDEATESLIVRHMRKLGAIPFCKTSVPQSMSLANTSNNIHGRTLNPYMGYLCSGGAAGGRAPASTTGRWVSYTDDR